VGVERHRQGLVQERLDLDPRADHERTVARPLEPHGSVGVFDRRRFCTDAGPVTTEPAEVTAAEARPPGFRIRWGWFLGCVVVGLAAIVVGWLVASPAGRPDYLTGVLANAGTTLLLVGAVVLLERRIVDSAVRTFRNAAEEARAKMRDDFRSEVQEFSDRVSAEWATTSPEDVEAMKERTRRLAKELTDSYVAETTQAYDGDATPGR
jgi:hypothetical protein